MAPMTLTNSQYSLWDVKWRRINWIKWRINWINAGGPSAALTMAHLAGAPPHNTPQDLPPAVPADIRGEAPQAILQMHPAGSPECTEVKQGMSEPFTTVMDPFTGAV